VQTGIGLSPRALSTLFLLLALTITQTVIAQSDAVEGDETDEKPLVLDRFAVTGYHLKRTDMQGPAPVVVFTMEDLDQSGVNTLDDFFRYLPQNLGNDGETLRQYSSSAGAASINLRGIGIDSTLTLIDGYRITPYGNYGANIDPYVDINSIPISAIERIEILKDGASAIYGADAIAGVVNIILRKNYTGIELSAGYLTTTEGDGAEWNVDLLWGWQNESTNIMLSLSYFDKNPVLAKNRSFADDVDFSDQGGPNYRAFNSSPSTWYRYDNFLEGVDEDCGIDPFITSVAVHPFFGAYCAYNFAYVASLTNDSESFGGTFLLDHAFNDQLRGFADFFYSRRDNIQTIAPSPIVGGVLFPTLFGLPYVPANHPDNPEGVDLELAYRAVDLGNRVTHSETDIYRFVVGLEGNADLWDWKASLLTSRSNIDSIQRNSVFNSRLQLGLVGMGGDGGNLWYNPFGADPGNSPEILDWTKDDLRLGSKTTEWAADMEASTWFGNLPGGDIGMAVGIQFRHQEIDQYADKALQSGEISGGGGQAAIDSDRDVFSAFAEFNLPLHATLEAQLAARYEHYSDFGSSTNPKVAMKWQPISSLALRGSWGTSFKPPSFRELYDPDTLDSRFYTDVERCEITGAVEDCQLSAYNRVYRGNPNLQPEDGSSTFLGVVWSPDFWPGFSFEVDYWKFKHEDRIILLDPQVILDANGDTGILREPQTPEDIELGAPGRIILVEESFRNSDVLKTSGLDFTAFYSWETEKAGEFRASLFATWISEYKLTDTNLFNAEPGKNYAGKYFANTFPVPRWRGNFNLNWNLLQHAASATVHYTGQYQNNTNEWEDGFETDRPWTIPDRFTLDIQYSYIFKKLRDAVLRVGCQNCTDEKPPTTFTMFGEYFHDPRGALVYIRWQQPF
jgi:outer membrane receptor protein involved in Fe transport